jgi:hypothetical protein
MQPKKNINFTSKIQQKVTIVHKRSIVKRQFTKWDKIFVNHVFDKGLISRIKNSYNSTTNTPEAVQLPSLGNS